MGTVRAAGLIVFRVLSTKVEYLMLQTSYGQHHWTPPKGHVDPGEGDMETALRETSEEAGLTADQLQILEEFRTELHYTVKNKPKTVVYWLARLLNPETPVKLSNEHQDFRWAELDEACQLADYPDQQQALRQCHECILKRAAL